MSIWYLVPGTKYQVLRVQLTAACVMWLVTSTWYSVLGTKYQVLFSR